MINKLKRLFKPNKDIITCDTTLLIKRGDRLQIIKVNLSGYSPCKKVIKQTKKLLLNNIATVARIRNGEVLLLFKDENLIVKLDISNNWKAIRINN